MPRVQVRIADHVVTELLQRAEEQEARDELWVHVLSEFVLRKGTVAPTSASYHDRMRQKTFNSTRMPRTIAEIPDDLFAEVDKLAKRLHKSRELLYSR
jgi:Arc/MetJ family transcription regulator